MAIYYSGFVLICSYASDSVGCVNINHFPWRVCKSIDLNPKYMEQFVKILSSIVCEVIGSSIWEALVPSNIKIRPVWWPTHSFILRTFVASYYVPGSRGIWMTKTIPVPELTIQGEVTDK